MVEQIQGLLTQFFSQEEMKDHFLVEIIENGKKLEIYLDSDTAITFDICKKVSRFLEEYLDEQGIMGDDYILEVSSAGVGKPLKFPRQFKKNIGRKIQITTKSGEKHVGILSGSDDMYCNIQQTIQILEGKKKKKQDITLNFQYSEIDKAKILISI